MKRGRRARIVRAVAGGVGLLVLGAVAYVLLTPRTVTIVGPTASTITVADKDPYGFPARVGMIVRLRPGEHAIDSDSPENRPTFDVPVFAKGLVVPARRDHCLLVASAANAYAFEGETKTGDAFTVIERSVESYATPLLVDRVVTDPCLLPRRLELLDSVYVAFAVRCDEAPADDATANLVLTAAMLDCG
ncbi:MAG: hypothetical protein AAF721_39325 [Myxococcota bacterium]